MNGGTTMENIWEGVIAPILPGRSQKPRTTGFTMVLDKWLGLRGTQDLIDTAGAYIDDVKLTFGTSVFYEKGLLEKKIDLLRSANIHVMPGGTMTEIAVWEGVYPQFLKRAKEQGFSMIEVSDGTITMSAETRRDLIKRAADEGFVVITEVGTKDLKHPKASSLLNEQIHEDLSLGATRVVIEAKEAGKATTIYNEQGLVKEDEVAALVAGLDNLDCLIWEAPIRDQQDYLVARFGANVNIGNCPPEGVLSLEVLRNGLGETPFRLAYQARLAGRRGI
jgi:phosphosulfolactate synthase